MKFDAIIFDLDGVLCTTDHLHYLGWKKLADREGIYFDEAINQRLRGVSRMESLTIILERAAKTYTEDEMAEMAAYKNDQYRKLLDTLTPEDLSDEVKDTLKMLRSRGLKLAVGSSSKNTMLILEKLGGGGHFDAAGAQMPLSSMQEALVQLKAAIDSYFDAPKTSAPMKKS